MKLILLIVLGLAGCSKPAKPASDAWSAHKGGVEVMRFKNSPGILGSMALPPPAGTPIKVHPFLTVQSFDPMAENDLYEAILVAKNFPDFLNKMRSKGYVIEPSAPDSLEGVDAIIAAKKGKRAVLFTKASDSSVEIKYLDRQFEKEISEIRKMTSNFNDLALRLNEAGYELTASD